MWHDELEGEARTGKWCCSSCDIGGSCAVRNCSDGVVESLVRLLFVPEKGKTLSSDAGLTWVGDLIVASGLILLSRLGE